ncbi:multicopper oxidase family protein [Sandaracinus amylolyticus]|nr:multicopper oxidase [Sandaracinus amylolyticus]
MRRSTSMLAIGVASLSTLACTNVSPPASATLDATRIPQFVQPLPIPAPMEPTGRDGDVVEYRIEARQFEQQILPPPLPTTTVWGYGREGDPSSFHSPSRTIEARSGEPVRVTWINALVDDDGDFLPHLLPVDATLHWADPGGHGHHVDADAVRYTGPVPTVTHVHGAHSFDHSDGHPEAWFLPDARDIPEGFRRRGPTYRTQGDAGEGAAVFEYPHDEPATTLWYHDHSLGMTRVNVYAGLAGMWILRDDVEDALGLPGPAPRIGDAEGTRYFEIPLVIQDRSFTNEGALAYPTSRTEFGDYDGPYAPDSDVPPIWNPEVFGDVMVVNGAAWPYLEVEPRLYRFRILNASDSRTLILHFSDDRARFVQIGGDGGLLSEAPVTHEELVVGPAERYDVLVDLSRFAEGDTITLLNRGPDEAWGGPHAMPPQDPADPTTTGRVMQLRVIARSDAGTEGAVPDTLPVSEVPTTALAPRDLVLIEEDVEGTDAPLHVMLGTLEEGALMWDAPATEVVQLGDTEVWRVANTTDDAHPIHLHLVQFRVLDRIPFDADAFSTAQERWLDGEGAQPVLEDFVTGAAIPALPQERGPKDTVMVWPGTITRFVATFDRAGEYVWHCHILEHEDNDMMRPLVITP